jgi:hypothetical protein
MTRKTRSLVSDRATLDAKKPKSKLGQKFLTYLELETNTDVAIDECRMFVIPQVGPRRPTATGVDSSCKSLDSA